MKNRKELPANGTCVAVMGILLYNAFVDFCHRGGIRK